jgi:3-oxoacyl-[acyl-carrier protein] reductase
MAETSSSEQTSPAYVIIGAAGGIGSAVAWQLHAAGARLMLAGRTLEKLEPLAAALNARQHEVEATDFKAVEACLQTAQSEFGQVDGVLNCAGSILLKPAHLTTEVELREVIDQNLVSAFATVRAAAGVMRKNGGSIVLMSSAAAEIGLPNHEAIAAAKAGVVGLMRSAAATYAAQRIRVNVVAPGLVETPMSERITANETSKKASIAMHPLGRLGQPEDIAQPICWLLSPESSWVTGQMIGVDGGLASLKARPAKPA